MFFFENYKPHKKHTLKDLESLFKFCREIQASISWIKLLKDPELLMGEKALLTGCCTPLRLLLECKAHYSHEYFTLVDYVIESKFAGPSVDGFVKMIKVSTILIDKSWIQLFEQYASTENTYTKSTTIKIGAQVLGVLTKPIQCSLVMDVVELAITMNKCEEIKTVLKSGQAFRSIEEFKALMNLWLEEVKYNTKVLKEKDTLKQEIQA